MKADGDVSATPGIGGLLFRLRSLTPVPVGLGCVLLLAWNRGAAGPGGPQVDLLLDLLGASLAAAGQALRFFTLGQVPEGTSGQDLSLKASTLNTRGPYAHVRNPLYVGNLGITLGLLCIANDAWVYALGLGFFFGEYFFIIRAEERFLRERFGEAFDQYCRLVRRWVPRLSAAYAGTLRVGGFDAGRAVKKEINPLFAWVTAATALLAWESHARGSLSTPLLALLVTVEAIVLMALVIIKAWKKGWLFA